MTFILCAVWLVGQLVVLVTVERKEKLYRTLKKLYRMKGNKKILIVLQWKE